MTNKFIRIIIAFAFLLVPGVVHAQTTYSDNFDSDTTGVIAPGWSAISGTWNVNTNNPVSAPNAFGKTTPVDSTYAVYTGIPPTSGIDLRWDAVWATTTSIWPIINSNSSASSGYLIQLLSSSTFEVQKCTALGAFSTTGLSGNVSAGFGFTPTVGEQISMRVDYSGTGTIRYRIWPYGNAEPSTWLGTVTDATPVTAAGYISLRYGVAGSGTTLYSQIDNVTITNSQYASPASGYVITGSSTLSAATPSTFTISTNTGVNPVLSDTVVYSDNLSPHGTFSPSTQTFATTGATIFTTSYTPPTGYAGPVTLTATSGNGLTAGTFSATVNAPAATAYTVTGPSVGPLIIPATFTVAPNGSYTGTITPSISSGPTGTFSPTSLTWSATSSAQTFTFTPATSGTAVIATTSSPSITNSSGNLNYAIAATVMTATTNAVANSCFAPSSSVVVTFTITGLTTNETLTISDQDANSNIVATGSVPVTNVGGNATIIWSPPSTATLGCFRVIGTLTDGAIISGYGSRPAGWITYAIMPNPSTRNFSPSENVTRFGMEGGFNNGNGTTDLIGTNLQPWLGIHWETDPAQWSSVQQAQATVPADPGLVIPAVTYGGNPWTLYPLFGMTSSGIGSIPTWAANSDHATVNPAYMAYWTAYCVDVARWAKADYPNLPVRYYQPSWELSNAIGAGEPIATFCNSLYNMFNACYAPIHSADSNAFIIGHTPYSAYLGQQAEFNTLANLGFNSVVDGAADHAYFATTNTSSGPLIPEVNSYSQNTTMTNLSVSLDNIRSLFYNKPLFITEQGYTSAQTAASELLQAEVDTRQSLIDVGEKVQFLISFYAVDYYNTGLQQWGYFYNLGASSPSSIPYSPPVVQPKPAAAAFSAMTWLLEGSTSNGAMYGLGNQCWGYSFSSGKNTIYALWSSASSPQVVTVPVMATTAAKYDWMGNASTVSTSANTLSLTLTGEPTYVVFATPASGSSAGGTTVNINIGSGSTSITGSGAPISF